MQEWNISVLPGYGEMFYSSDM